MLGQAKRWLKAGNPWVWLTAGAVSICLISVLGLLLLIGWKGLVYFWPTPVYQWQDAQGNRLIGQVYQRDWVSLDQLSSSHKVSSKLSPHERWPAKTLAKGEAERLSIKVANREIYPKDFISVLTLELKHQTQPHDVAVFERNRNGAFFATPIGYQIGSDIKQDDLPQRIQTGIEKAKQIRAEIADIRADKLSSLSQDIANINRKLKSSSLQKTHSDRTQAPSGLDTSLLTEKKKLQQKFNQQEQAIVERQALLTNQQIIVQDMQGKTYHLPLESVLDMWYPNAMSPMQKVQHWFVQVGKFLTDSPRDANSEGGVFPAIFGTVLLVIIMSIVVMPLGVIAAVYLHEYAPNTLMTKLIRVSVVNLAGVPSIVYGVFGLGFFVYTIGGTIDSLFYSASLPTPTFGTPGLLWSALTLAILTLPVVIVATEEGLSRIPSSLRNGSYALGATKFETLWRIVLPMVSPAIMTGLILAVARAAGEVAPLMLVGVVKLAPSLPIDGSFPYLHLDRKFMHLGFHIYDLGFQTPNIEAARPLVYATSFLLITVVIGLNITAIMIRNNLREKFKILGSD
ncbi:phosphate ABC transporter permease PstA [Vibrio algicola]|uniref:Phosphate transport system permease protein PstA n=1 Tax=Vibrio algicola TaxID=2662262 RepID=A0A5Q0TF82_9VIBR|nr:phosphate ABC transporter permease PstA [Vibrio algicola]